VFAVGPFIIGSIIAVLIPERPLMNIIGMLAIGVWITWCSVMYILYRMGDRR
jgi:hypothetical protein